MTHQALTTYRALLDAAAVAPYEFFSVWSGREANDGHQSHVIIPTGHNSTMRLANCQERLHAMAEKVRTHWALFGGGPKPAELKPKPKRAAAWSARMMSVWSAALEEGHQDDILRIAIQHLGGRVYKTGDRAAFLLFAPQPVEGLPAQLQSWRRDDGQWVVAEVNTGHATDNIGRSSRREAERRALVAWDGIEPDRRAALLAACAANHHSAGRSADPCDALADWCKARGLEDVPEYVVAVAADPVPVVHQSEPVQVQHQAHEPAELVQAPEPAPEVHQARPVQVQAQHQAPEPAELVHQAPEPGSVNPAGAPVPDVLTGAHVRRLMRAHGATIERLAGLMGIPRARVRQVRARGLSGLPYVLDWLQGITGQAPAFAGGIWWHNQARRPGEPPGARHTRPRPAPDELVTEPPGASAGGSVRPESTRPPDYPTNSHGLPVALAPRFHPFAARPMGTPGADIGTRRAPFRTRWRALQPVQARPRVPCPGAAGRPGGRGSGAVRWGRAPPSWVSRPVRHPPPGVAASADEFNGKAGARRC